MSSRSLLIVLLAAAALGSTAAVSAQEFPLSEPGPFNVGVKSDTFRDPARQAREISLTVWYPSVRPQGSPVPDPKKTGLTAKPGDPPDTSGAPYPLVLSSTKVARFFAPRLVSRGFVWASVDGIDSYREMNEEMIDQPMDILAALERVASAPPPGLEGLIDAEHAGAVGYSFDGYNSLALGGVRIDPGYYLAQCPRPDATTAALVRGGFTAFSCTAAGSWEAFAAHAGPAVTTSSDGLWQPLTDRRIRAVMPMACEGWWLFGARGLAAADRPTLMIVGERDEMRAENLLIFRYLGTPEKALISFVGKSHMMIYETGAVTRMAHFAAAFFGHRLKGREDLAFYYSREFVAGHADLVWGTDRNSSK